MGRRLIALALLGACNAHLGDPSQHVQGGGDGGSSDIDASQTTLPDATIPLGPWGTPTAIPGAMDATNNEDDPTLSSDGLELYFAMQVPMADKNLYVMKRASRQDPFGTPAPLDNFNTAGTDEGPRLSYDDLTIYYGVDGDIFQSTRAALNSPWGASTKVPGVSTAVYEKWLAVCGDGSHFVVSRLNGAANGQDLYQGTLGGGAGTLIANVSSTSSEISTFLSKDCLTLYFASNRANGTQIYYSTRAAIGDAWGDPVAAPAPFDVGTDNEDAGYTPDNRLFVFASSRAGNGSKDLFISTR